MIRRSNINAAVRREASRQYAKSFFKKAMKTLFYSVVMLVFSFCAKAQENNPFTTGFEKRLPSKILDEQRTVWIHIPTSNGGIGTAKNSCFM